jgi:hypothetical protein
MGGVPVRKPKTEEERVRALERMNASIHQLQAKEGPYYEKWRMRYNAWRESQARKE